MGNFTMKEKIGLIVIPSIIGVVGVCVIYLILKFMFKLIGVV
jgi:hypothetical protein